MTRTMFGITAILIITFAGSLQVLAQDVAVQESDVSIGKKEYSPYLHQAHPNRVYWRDTPAHIVFHRCRYDRQPAGTG